MKLKDATNGQPVWLADGTKCIVSSCWTSRQRQVWIINASDSSWLPLDTEVSTEPPPKPKPTRTLADLPDRTIVFIDATMTRDGDLFVLDCDGDFRPTTLFSTYRSYFKPSSNADLIEGRDFTVYGPAEIAADGTITIRPAKAAWYD